MSTVVDALPQNLVPIKITTLAEVVKVLPKKLNFPINVWIAGKIARYGQTSENLIFLVEQEGETSTELKMYFEEIAKPYLATVSSFWKDERITALRIYNEGKFIIDKETLVYTELPSPTKTPPILTIQEVIKFLPKEIPFKETVYITGSLVKYGWSGNDVDFMVDTTNREVFRDMRIFFSNILHCKVDVGNAPMQEREPIYKYLLYEKGESKWQL